jgi:choline kinase/2-phospho-L-lactate transferase/gluconeogenesis factor (CofD/UPF0052 family)
MIITLISGGSGSENIQRGLYKINKNISINIIINGYDDGNSTGILRKLFRNTLGISDFRKNQVLEYNLIYGNNHIYKILNNRFTCAYGEAAREAREAREYLLKLINDIEDDDIRTFLITNTEYFFNLEESKQIIYEDFNYMNIIYCALLHQNDFNIITVCNIIKKLLGLKNNIYVNSHENLILQGITANNRILLNEESIVNFNDVSDKIIDIKFQNDFENDFQNDKLPVLNSEAAQLLRDSDIILLSCGTQFSSLIPTYKTELFDYTFKQSNARKYLVLNCDYDKDIVNYTGDELLDKIGEYISSLKDDVKIIVSDNMNPELFPSNKCYDYINIPHLITNNKHDGFILWKYIFADYFREYYNKNYVFDYDYTLYDEQFVDTSEDNIACVNKIDRKIIVTNNCITNISVSLKNCKIFSNISNIENSRFADESDKPARYINENYVLSQGDIDFIRKIINKITYDTDTEDGFQVINRKNISIALKPLLNRDKIIEDININKYLLNTNYDVIKTGKTTIEFIKKGACKRELFLAKQLFDGNHTYISDDNDIDYTTSDNIKYLNVASINTTNLFMKSLIYNKKYDFCIIAGGINQRMQIKYPKCLVKIDNKIVLTGILEKIIPYANTIYVCCNNHYKSSFLEYEKTAGQNENIKFLYFNSVDNSQNYPKGNGETLYQLLDNFKLTDKAFVMWSDIIISNNRIFEEMYNLQYDNDFLIPTVYEEDPYAYLIIEDAKVKSFGYRRDSSIEYGYHDQCIFLVNTRIVKDRLKNIIDGKKYDEVNFLDVVSYIDGVSYYETKYPIISYNSFEDISSSFGQTS